MRTNYRLRVSIPNTYVTETVSVGARNGEEAVEKIRFLIQTAWEHPKQDPQIVVVDDA